MIKIINESYSIDKFEASIPHNMRFKEFDYLSTNNDDNEDLLYWICQEEFSKEDFIKFITEASKLDVDKVAVTTRDFSSYDYDIDNKRGVLAKADLINKKFNYTNYDNTCKKMGWRK